QSASMTDFLGGYFMGPLHFINRHSTFRLHQSIHFAPTTQLQFGRQPGQPVNELPQFTDRLPLEAMLQQVTDEPDSLGIAPVRVTPGRQGGLMRRDQQRKR